MSRKSPYLNSPDINAIEKSLVGKDEKLHCKNEDHRPPQEYESWDVILQKKRSTISFNTRGPSSLKTREQTQHNLL